LLTLQTMAKTFEQQAKNLRSLDDLPAIEKN